MGMVDRVKAQTVPEAKQASCGAGFGDFCAAAQWRSAS